MVEVKNYDNGLRLVLENCPTMKSINMSFWVGTGSAYEVKENNGLSHFIEHMTFKGTDKYTPFDIANIFESYGASVNAFTSKEYTCFYAKSITEYGKQCFELLSDILFHSTFPAEELDKERKVIIEELNMGEDNPEGICYDLLANAVYGDKSLGQTIIGTNENISRFNSDDIRAYMNEFYVANNIVISITGNIDINTCDDWINTYVLSELKPKKEIVYPTNTMHSNYIKRVKDCEQANIAIAFPGIEFESEQSVIQSTMNTILGNGMSSRLFQSVREQQGLAYSIYSLPTANKFNGFLGVYLNINKDNTQQAVLSAKKEIDLMMEKGVTDQELDRAKVILKSNALFAYENMQSIMVTLGRLMILKNKPLNIDEMLDSIDKVTKNDIIEFARNIFDYSKASIAYVGRDIDVNIQDLLK